MTDRDHRVVEYPVQSRDIQRPSGEHDRRPDSGRRLLGLSALLLLLCGLALGVWRHYARHLEVTAAAEQHRDFVPTVRVEAVRASPATMSVTLPATTNAFEAANIYARASGYITQRNVDIGSHVKAGDLLAGVPAPGPDPQNAPAQAGPVHLGPRCCSGEARLGHPAAGGHRSPELCGSAAGQAC